MTVEGGERVLRGAARGDRNEDAPSSETTSAGRARRALLANMRHELRTPINAIIGYSEMLLEDAETLGRDDIAPDVEKINSAGKHLLAILNDLLDATKIEAASIDVSSESFGAHVRHELRTPLSAVIGYSEMLIESFEDCVQDEFVADLRKIETAARRLLDLLDDIISLSRIEAGRAELDIEKAPDSSAVREVVLAIRSLNDGAAESTHIERGSLLVVDDNELNRDMLSRQLERQGYRVATATNGREALDAVRAQEFDLVLLDMVMPVMNGYEVLLALKGDDSLRHIPVIMVTALDEMDSLVRCIELGADDYLPKPFNPVLLRARIGACLERKWLRDREQAYLEQLRLERERSERLLLNVLPEPIAERLKRGEERIADTIADATVLFADIVGFTRLSGAVPASELVSLLDEVFSAFDRLAERHGLEKIKTIGDAYMAAAGLPHPRVDHAEAAAEMALDMLDAVAVIRDKRGGQLSMRIGMNAGPVVAGVIGTRKFIYDLWGDTVNTASRMESHGIPDTIGVTATVRDRLNHRYLLEERGSIPIKDKGRMRVYLLRGRRSPE